MPERNISLIEALPFGIACCDAEGVVLRGNRRLGELLELPEDIELGEALAAVLGADWFARLPFDFETEGGQRLSLRLGRSDDTQLLIVDDCSEAKLLEATRDHVARRLSHDLRSPVAAIIGLARSVVDGVLPPDREGFERILQQAELALGRSDAMLGVLRAAALKAERLEPVDLVRVVHEAGDVCWSMAKRRGAALTVEDPVDGESECLVFGELDALRRAAQRFVELALQRGAGNALVLRLADDDTCWRIDVRPETAPEPLAPSDAETLLMRIVAWKHGGELRIDPDSQQPYLLLPKLIGDTE
jgi:signal transduction histidine kinase